MSNLCESEASFEQLRSEVASIFGRTLPVEVKCQQAYRSLLSARNAAKPWLVVVPHTSYEIYSCHGLGGVSCVSNAEIVSLRRRADVSRVRREALIERLYLYLNAGVQVGEGKGRRYDLGIGLRFSSALRIPDARIRHRKLEKLYTMRKRYCCSRYNCDAGLARSLKLPLHIVSQVYALEPLPRALRGSRNVACVYTMPSSIKTCLSLVCALAEKLRAFRGGRRSV
jgi:hypothetical protein